MSWNQKNDVDPIAWIGAALVASVLVVVGAYLGHLISSGTAGAVLALITVGMLVSTRAAQDALAEDLVESILPTEAKVEEPVRKAA